MYLYYKETDYDEPDVKIIFNDFKEAKESLIKWNDSKAKLFECVDITDLASYSKDKSKVNMQIFIRYGYMGLDGVENPEKFGDINYARWVMHQYNLPADFRFDTKKYRNQFPLYCTYKGKRYKYLGHSRLGNVWITSEFSSTEYELGVSILDLENFSKEI